MVHIKSIGLIHISDLIDYFKVDKPNMKLYYATQLMIEPHPEDDKDYQDDPDVLYLMYTNNPNEIMSPDLKKALDRVNNNFQQDISWIEGKFESEMKRDTTKKTVENILNGEIWRIDYVTLNNESAPVVEHEEYFALAEINTPVDFLIGLICQSTLRG